MCLSGAKGSCVGVCESTQQSGRAGVSAWREWGGVSVCEQTHHSGRAGLAACVMGRRAFVSVCEPTHRDVRAGLTACVSGVAG